MQLVCCTTYYSDSLHLMLGSVYQSADLAGLFFLSTVGGLPFVLSSILTLTRSSTRSSLLSASLSKEKICKPRRCVSLPFWWFSKILICTRWARRMGSFFFFLGTGF